MCRRELAERAGVTPEQVRYWETTGMLAVGDRNHRHSLLTEAHEAHVRGIKLVLPHLSLMRIRRATAFLSGRTHLRMMLSECRTGRETLAVYDHASEWCEDDDSGVYRRERFRRAVKTALALVG